MGFAPLPDPLHVGRVPEVIAIGRLTQPAPLTGGLAGATASRCATVKLASPVMGVRREEKTAARALAAAGREIHRAPSRKKMRRAGQSKNLQPQGRTREEERKNLGLKAEENPKEENGISNRQDYPTFISPLTSPEGGAAGRRKHIYRKQFTPAAVQCVVHTHNGFYHTLFGFLNAVIRLSKVRCSRDTTRLTFKSLPRSEFVGAKPAGESCR